jgi:regulator of replication initiation timing
MAMIDNARAYMGRTWIGANASDKGECVGLFNVAVRDATGVLYPIQGASTAYEILGANNTRPDLCQQIRNNPSDPSQLPSVGDWVIWNTNIGNGAGHIACVETVSSVAMTTIDQNWVRATVTRENHAWLNVAGWIHFNMNNAVPPPPPVNPLEAENKALKAENASLKAQIGTANQQLAAAQKTIEALNAQLAKQAETITQLTKDLGAKQAEINDLSDDNAKLATENAELKAQLATCSEDTGNLNKLGVLLQWLIQRLGLSK